MSRRTEARKLGPTGTWADLVKPSDVENWEALGEAERLYKDDPAAELAAVEAGTHPLQRRKPARR